MAPAIELAKQVANTEFVPKSLRGNGPAIVAAILYGDELGLGPMQALAKIAVIDGKPSLSSETQRALILQAGHDIWIVESSATKATMAGRRNGSDHTSTVTWTMDDAKRAGLAGRQNWRSYPRQMLAARATAELARLIFADAIGGLVATEEVEEMDGTPEAPAPAPKGNKRKRASSATPETSDVIEAEQAPVELPPLPDEPFLTAAQWEIEAHVAAEEEANENGDPLPEDPGASSTSSPEENPSEPQDRLIDAGERRRLFAVARANAVGEDHLRHLVEEITGNRSTKEMTVGQMQTLVQFLEGRAVHA
jgi:hypothetical protein